MRVFLDACILIYYVEGNSAASETVRAQIRALPEDATLCTTELIRFEVLCGAAAQSSPAVKQAYETVLARMEYVSLTRPVFDLAAKVRADNRLKALDSLHVAAAVTSGCDQFWTNDSKLAALVRMERTEVKRVP